jgi:mannobiose 2-epimerase
MKSLAHHCLQPWLDHAHDPQGGAYGFLNRRLEPIVDDGHAPLGPSGEIRGDKSLIQQTRHLYSYSFAFQQGLRTQHSRTFADSCFQLLKESFWRGEGLPMIHLLTHLHQPRREKSQIYAQSFAIYGLSTYSLIFNNQDAARMALDLFETLDARFHDERFGGYDQRDDGGWLDETEAPAGSRKCTNTHIHVLEALTPLLECYPEHRNLRRRLVEMVQVIGLRLLQPSGYVHKHFTLDWKPVGPAECSYGHDLETSWLILEGAKRLDSETQTLAKVSARLMAQHALKAGWDSAGGVFDFGPPALKGLPPEPQGREKVWWAQAEALPGIYQLLLQTNDDRLVDCLESTFNFLQDKLWDPKYGEFYWSVMSDGRLGTRGDHKGEIWKTPYHALRALLTTSAWIEGLVAPPLWSPDL